MKTKHLFFAAALSLLAACQVELQDNNLLETVENEKGQEEKVIPPEVTASQEVNTPTKSILEVDETGHGDIYWTPYDEINVFYGTTSTHYVSKNTENAATAVFKTSDVIGISETASENIWGLYPYNENATCTGSAVTTTLPATQYGVPGTFDDDLFITLAHNTSTALTFYNVCGGIKFSLSRDDITSITFRGNNSEDIAGDVSLSFSEGLPTVSVTSGVKEITLTPKAGGTFDSGEYYYLIIRPVTLENGFTVSFLTDSGLIGVFEYTSSEVSIKRSKFGKKDNLDSFATFSIPNNQIWYTSTNGESVTPYRSDFFGANIITNNYLNGHGVIAFDGDVKYIGIQHFYNRSTLSTMIVPPKVTIISNNAFTDCTSLSEITLPYGVTEIRMSAFYGCSSLSAITIPASVTSIGNQAFYGSGLSSITIPEGVLNLGDRAFQNCPNLTAVTIPGSVASFGAMAFYWCADLVSVTILEGITNIGNRAFERCTTIPNITLPSSVSSIGENAFYFCSSLHTLVVLSTTPPTVGNSDFLYHTSEDLIIYVPEASIEAYKTAPIWSDHANRILPIE